MIRFCIFLFFPIVFCLTKADTAADASNNAKANDEDKKYDEYDKPSLQLANMVNIFH